MRSFFLILSLYATAGFPGQVERYDGKFFIQLRGIFGRFRDSDLQRAFENAHPIRSGSIREKTVEPRNGETVRRRRLLHLAARRPGRRTARADGGNHRIRRNAA